MEELKRKKIYFSASQIPACSFIHKALSLFNKLKTEGTFFLLEFLDWHKSLPSKLFGTAQTPRYVVLPVLN